MFSLNYGKYTQKKILVISLSNIPLKVTVSYYWLDMLINDYEIIDLVRNYGEKTWFPEF